MPRTSTTVAKSTPKDVFMHLLGIATLIVSVISFITLWFQYIDVRFPDALQYYGAGSYYLDNVRWALAMLVIVFPVYILVAWIMGRDYKADQARREVRARKWLLYLTLFIAAIAIIVSLITLLYNYLNGDLTVSFALKIAVVLGVAAAVFGYYIWDLRRTDFSSTKPKMAGWIAAVVVIATASIGFYLVGTPATQRARKFDERRINDLQLLNGSIINYWTIKRQLPPNLATLAATNYYGDRIPQDPETGQPYEYNIKSDLSYELCASFKLPHQDNSNIVKPVPAYDSRILPYPPYGNDSWNHSAGRACFTRTIDPTLYPTPSTSPKPL